MSLPPEIQRDRDVERLAKKAKLPPYMWDTLEGLAALARFMDLAITAPEAGFLAIGNLHRPRDGTVHFVQEVLSIPLPVHGFLQVYMKAGEELPQPGGKLP